MSENPLGRASQSFTKIITPYQRPSSSRTAGAAGVGVVAEHHRLVAGRVPPLVAEAAKSPQRLYATISPNPCQQTPSRRIAAQVGEVVAELAVGDHLVRAPRRSRRCGRPCGPPLARRGAVVVGHVDESWCRPPRRPGAVRPEERDGEDQAAARGGQGGDGRGDGSMIGSGCRIGCRPTVRKRGDVERWADGAAPVGLSVPPLELTVRAPVRNVAICSRVTMPSGSIVAAQPAVIPAAATRLIRPRAVLPSSSVKQSDARRAGGGRGPGTSPSARGSQAVRAERDPRHPPVIPARDAVDVSPRAVPLSSVN